MNRKRGSAKRLIAKKISVNAGMGVPGVSGAMHGRTAPSILTALTSESFSEVQVWHVGSVLCLLSFKAIGILPYKSKTQQLHILSKLSYDQRCLWVTTDQFFRFCFILWQHVILQLCSVLNKHTIICLPATQMGGLSENFEALLLSFAVSVVAVFFLCRAVYWISAIPS